ncbi:hypothetical protein CRG98_011980 [Punica granatum]|uniref:Uncharacterized protein n=1 Tax=Punica granatum TaxID=22663 RepID=A0A2I0KGI6_PUNGR|nr:hypothetical protein CRG98_011980 [Punica granatum]
MTGASVPSHFPETATAAPSPGSPTRNVQPESCDSHDRFPDSFPRASRLGAIRNGVKGPPKLDSGQGVFGRSPLKGGRITRDPFGVSVGLSIIPKSILGTVCDCASF